MNRQQTELVNALRAGFSLFYARTGEMDRTIALITEAVTTFTNKAGQQPFVGSNGSGAAVKRTQGVEL